MAQRANVLRAYRVMLALARHMPAAERGSTVAEARSAIRGNAGEREPGAASDQLKALWARISFLRVVRCRGLRVSSLSES